MTGFRSRTALVTAGLVIALSALTGCSGGEPDLTDNAAKQLQSGVLVVTTAAADGDFAAAKSALAELQADVRAAIADGEVTRARSTEIQAAIALVAVDLEAAIAARTPEPTIAPEPPEPTQEPEEEPTDEPEEEPTDEPTDEPTEEPEDESTEYPTDEQTNGGTDGPGYDEEPSNEDQWNEDSWDEDQRDEDQPDEDQPEEDSDSNRDSPETTPER